jgi:hypothetical protein
MEFAEHAITEPVSQGSCSMFRRKLRYLEGAAGAASAAAFLCPRGEIVALPKTS